MYEYDFTVVIPVLNREKYIEKCINSIISQRTSETSIEIIILDGGSTDGTIEILKKYSDEVYWESILGLGQTGAIKRGFLKGSGKILSWINSDDMYLPGSFSYVKKYFIEHTQTDFVYGNCLYIDEKNSLIKKNTSHSYYLEQLLLYTDFMLSQESCFWRSKLYHDQGGITETVSYAMDYDLFSRIIKNKNCWFIDKDIAVCRVHKLQRHREKIGNFTIWNIERAYLQSTRRHIKNPIMTLVLVILLMVYKNFIIEKKYFPGIDKIFSIAFSKPYKTSSMI